MLVGPRRLLLLLRPLCPRSALPSHTVRLLSTSSRSTIARLLNGDPSSSSSLAHHSPTPVAGETVSVNGWVRSVRKQKRIAFAAVGDGSSLAPLQVVMSPELATGLSTGVGVAITGQWQPSPPGTQQAQELHAQHIRVLGENDSAKYPLQKKFHTTEFLRTVPHLRTRTPFNSLMLRLRSHVIAQVTAFFASRDYVQSHPPVITSSDCEGAGEVFTVVAQGDAPKGDSGSAAPGEHFFRHPKYLTVSSQLHLEALSQSVGKAWCLSPAFRAEKSSTPRHLSEFYMLEAELSFVEQLDDVMDAVEELLRHVAVSLRDSAVGRELLTARSPEYSKGEENDGIAAEALTRRWEGLCRSDWPRISFAEAVTRLQDAQNRGEVSFQFAPSFDHGLQTEHEAFIANTVGQGSPVFVTDYPRSVKPFYMSPTNVGSSQHPPSETVACFDLLVPDTCELVGGSLREHRLPELLAAMDSHGMKVPTFSGASEDENSREVSVESSADDAGLQWYADLRRFGSVPHGGFGIGFDRLLSYLSGVPNLRDVVSFPRWHQRCDC
ncbi:asparaginyl-tRNA synthetase [Phyllosticta citrichinensis]